MLSRANRKGNQISTRTTKPKLALNRTEMVSEPSPSMASVADVVAEINGSFLSKKNRGKVPKKIHKAEREKLKRDHLNELFFELDHALDPARQNNGKASILCDAIRLLRDLIAHVGSLRKENSALLNESNYVTVEKHELHDDNVALQAEIGRLQNELQEKMNRDPAPLLDPSLSSLDPSVTPVFVVPLRQDLQQALTDSAGLPSPQNPSPHVSKPHARYPTSSDSWPLDFLTRNQEASGQVGSSNCRTEGADEGH